MSRLIDSCTQDNWTALNVDSTNVGVEAGGWGGKSVLTFDKEGTTLKAGGVYKLLAQKAEINANHTNPYANYVCWLLNASALTDIASTFLRLGTSASNYNEWTEADSVLTAGGCACMVLAATCTRTGTGCDWSAIKYIAVGVNVDATGSTLANIQVEKIQIMEAGEVGA